MRRLVDVPGGNLNHFQEPTRSYLRGSEDELASAKSTVTLTCVSTRDFVPPSGILGNIIGRLSERMAQDNMKSSIKERATHLKQVSFGGLTTRWLWFALSNLRGRDAGGGMGFMPDTSPSFEGTSRFVGRKSGMYWFDCVFVVGSS